MSFVNFQYDTIQTTNPDLNRKVEQYTSREVKKQYSRKKNSGKVRQQKSKKQIIRKVKKYTSKQREQKNSEEEEQ